MRTNNDEEALARAAHRTDDARRHCYQVWMLIGVAAVLYVAGSILNLLATPVAIVVWTVVIVLCLRSPVAKLESLGIPRAAGTAIAYAATAFVFGAFLAVMFSPVSGIADQFSDMLAGLPGYAQAVVDWANGLYGRYADVLQNESVREWLNSAAEALTSWASATARLSADGVLGFGTGLANSLMVIGFALVVAFWILMELPAIGREAARFVPAHRRQEAEMLHLTFTRVMGGYLKATFVQCFLIGAACGLGFWAIGIPNAAALGLITGVMNIVPVVGPWIGGAVAAVVALFVDPWAAVIALVYTIVVQQFVYTFISPKIMADSVDVHPAIVIVALFAGSAVGGAMAGLVGSVAGMLLSIPCVAMAKSVFVFYYEKRTGRQVVAEDGVFFRGTPTRLEGDAGLPDAVADAVAPPRRASSVRERLEAIVARRAASRDEARADADDGSCADADSDVSRGAGHAAPRDD
ncbi:MAG: AI-2E family transporter [Slackia sp.]|nr:AI-2E family transporter [Slackia sp.]